MSPAGHSARVRPPVLPCCRHPQADTWPRSVKATVVDTANRAVAELSLLAGASGFQAHSTLAKARADLGGLLYADGIHDSPLRSAGRTLTTLARIPAPRTAEHEPAHAPVA
ncbi:hypothetical protein [Kitasatospora mediocidica]|uniref:hypothetical protein n=1 Tax=Kitasatospora mediocidica TaxID=58352 RepID=UPI000566270D|nr:hypothetical protein [Kitasatospora mediocidica]